MAEARIFQAETSCVSRFRGFRNWRWSSVAARGAKAIG